MKLIILVFVSLSALALTMVTHASDTRDTTEQYLCVVDKSSGLSYDKNLKQWDTITFRSGRKYLISASRLPELVFQVTEVGDNDPSGWCEKGFTKFGILLCDMAGGNFKFNRNNGRFLIDYSIGYYNVQSDSIDTPAENANTPYVSIGKCSPF